MLSLTLDTTDLDLAPNTTATITLVNPIFDTDQIGRIFAYSFKLDNTPRNQKAFLYATRLDSRDKQVVYDKARLFLGGNLFEQGVLKIENTTNTKIQVVFQNRELNILTKMEDIRINEILDTIDMPFTGTTTWTFIASDNAPYVIQIDNTSYIPDGDLLTISKQDALFSIGTKINADYNNFSTVVLPDQLLLDFSLFPNATINFNNLVGFTLVSGQAIEQERHDSTLDFIEGTFTTPSSSHSWPVVRAQQLYGSDNSLFKGYVNYYKGGSFINNTPQDDKVWEHTFIPFVRLKYVLDQIATLLGISFGGDIYEDADVQKLLIWNNRTIDDLVIGNFTGVDKHFNQYQQSVNLNDHIPEISARELFNKINFFNYYFELDGTTLNLQTKVTQLRKPPIDWTKKAEPEYQNEFPEKSGFKLEYLNVDNEVVSYPQLQPFGTGENTIEFDTLPLYISIDLDLYAKDSSWLTPITNTQGTSQGTGNNSDYEFRLFLDQGQQEDNATNDYLMASHSNLDVYNQSVGNLSLTFEGTDGIYEKYWKGYAELADAAIITKAIRLTIQDLLELKKWRNSKRRIYHPEGEITAIIKTVQFKASVKGISVSKVELVKI